MGIMRKEIVARQKASFEEKLKARLAFLAGKGVKAPQTDRDPIVRNLKAEIKQIGRRQARIAEIDKRTEEMARIKAEKAAAPKEQPEAKSEKAKAAPAEPKAKKPKEKPEGAKPSKKAQPSGEPAPPAKAE